MKSKSDRITEKGYHHFVASLKINNCCYKAYITVKERYNSNILYVVSVILFQFDYLQKSIIAESFDYDYVFLMS